MNGGDENMFGDLPDSFLNVTKNFEQWGHRIHQAVVLILISISRFSTFEILDFELF